MNKTNIRKKIVDMFQMKRQQNETKKKKNKVKPSQVKLS